MDLSADALDSALKNGFNNVDRLRNDPDLNNLRKTKEFKKIVEKYKFFISWVSLGMKISLWNILALSSRIIRL